MPLPLLGIAQGAFNIGKKIFGGIKARQAKKKEKRAAKQLEKDNALANFAQSLGLGSTAVSQAGNMLQAAKSAAGQEDVSPSAESPKGNDGMKSPLVIGAIVIGGFVLLKALKIIK